MVESENVQLQIWNNHRYGGPAINSIQTFHYAKGQFP